MESVVVVLIAAWLLLMLPAVLLPLLPAPGPEAARRAVSVPAERAKAAPRRTHRATA